jgi:outer membrane scaffolding protein for murein synthesis (MipA/OmpV family)
LFNRGKEGEKMKNQQKCMGLLVALLALLLVISAAQAADFSIGGGLGVVPDYEGSEDYEIVPVPTGSAKFDNGMYVKLLGLNLKANLIPSDFWRLGPVYNYRSSRSDVDNGKVDDMSNVSDANELGLFGGIEWEGWYVFLEWLADTGDAHDGSYGSLKGGYNWIINEQWALTMGYMSTYFGVTGRDSARSGLDEYDADGGMKDVGVDLGVNWRFAQSWDLRGLLQVKRLVGDADDDSPVVDEGSETQAFTAVLVVFNF